MSAGEAGGIGVSRKSVNVLIGGMPRRFFILINKITIIYERKILFSVCFFGMRGMLEKTERIDIHKLNSHTVEIIDSQ